VSGTSTTETAVATTTTTTTTTTEAEPELVEVEIENFRFVPAEVTVRVGDTVRWSIASGTHTTTADGAVWSSPAMASAESFAWTFDTPGTFGYFCAIHPGMRGTITVEG
jgi:plastocyanin